MNIYTCNTIFGLCLSFVIYNQGNLDKFHGWAAAGGWPGPGSLAPSSISSTGASPMELSINFRKDFAITEKAPARALSWLKVPTSANTLLRHYA